MARPDYTTAREQSRFGWNVGSTIYTLLELTDISLGEYNLCPTAGIEVYRKGRSLFRECFPNPVIPLPGLHTPAISYGHVNGLGAELKFPDDGEVIHVPLFGSLDEGVAALGRPVDFSAAGMAPFYLEYKAALEEAFPGEKVRFAYGAEGPITTAYELRGQDFLCDILDDLPKSVQFLDAVTASINEFWTFAAPVNGQSVCNGSGSGLCDDVASMVPDWLFPQLVLPFWEACYQFRTTGSRSAHVEDLRVAQLPYLEEIGLSFFDPSISPRLTPPAIRDACRVPFGWRLGSFHYLTMTCDDVRDWVFQAVADGASRIFTYIEAILCAPEQRPKIEAFIEAASDAEAMLKGGCSRQDLKREVSAQGRERFWQHWPEQKTGVVS